MSICVCALYERVYVCVYVCVSLCVYVCTIFACAYVYFPMSIKFSAHNERRDMGRLTEIVHILRSIVYMCLH